MTQPLTQHDTGLGTTYERWALNGFLERLRLQTGIRSLLEGPGDGMTGIAGLNSLALARKGVDAALVLPPGEQAAFARRVWDCHAPGASLRLIESAADDCLPFDSQSFDLAWNFNVMPALPDPLAMLKELARVSRQYVLVVVPNRRNYSFGLHRLHHRVARQPWDHGRVELMDPAAWTGLFAQVGLQVRSVAWVDCPWWPDIVDPRQLIADFLPPLRRLVQRPATGSRTGATGSRTGATGSRRLHWAYPDLPYYRPSAFPQVHEQMEKLSIFEFSRFAWLRRMFGHHVAVLASKGETIS